MTMEFSILVSDKDGELVHQNDVPTELSPALVDRWTNLKGFHHLTCPFCNERQAEAMSGYRADHFYYQVKCKNCGTSVVFGNKCVFENPFEIMGLQQKFESIAIEKYRYLAIAGLKEKLRIT